MNLDTYRRKKAELVLSEGEFREVCSRCRRPQSACYCAAIRSFSSEIEFVILIHRDEARRGIASGRMAHLCLNNSRLLVGTNFSKNAELNSLLHNPQYFPVVLYPGPKSVNLSGLDLRARRDLFPPGRRPLMILIDGTWAQARKVKRLSTNLHDLPFVCFTPPTPSRFLVRQQPHPDCYSTIEAIHRLIELLGPRDNSHGNLLEVFEHMVQTQLDYERKFKALRGFRATRGIRQRF